MKNFDQQKFDNFVLENNVIGFFDQPITLKSGRISHWYVNWRTVSNDVHLLDQLTDFVINFVKDNNLKPDCFYAVPEGPTKLGVITQYKWAMSQPDYPSKNYPLAMGRGKPKEHGQPQDRYFIGTPQGKTIVVEDVTTTGGSLLETIKSLKEAKTNIVAILTLTDRMEKTDKGQSVKNLVKQEGIDFYRLSDAISLLPQAYQKFQPSKTVGQEVESYFRKYGVKPLKLI